MAFSLLFFFFLHSIIIQIPIFPYSHLIYFLNAYLAMINTHFLDNPRTEAEQAATASGKDTKLKNLNLWFLVLLISFWRQKQSKTNRAFYLILGI